jgi:hypothetical protein
MVGPDPLKTQMECRLKNRQSNRQKPEITSQPHQLTVLQSLLAVAVSSTEMLRRRFHLHVRGCLPPISAEWCGKSLGMFFEEDFKAHAFSKILTLSNTNFIN